MAFWFLVFGLWFFNHSNRSVFCLIIFVLEDKLKSDKRMLSKNKIPKAKDLKIKIKNLKVENLSLLIVCLFK
jgi:hypothetical protein